jgi:hypothetical protein
LVAAFADAVAALPPADWTFARFAAAFAGSPAAAALAAAGTSKDGGDAALQALFSAALDTLDTRVDAARGDPPGQADPGSDAPPALVVGAGGAPSLAARVGGLFSVAALHAAQPPAPDGRPLRPRRTGGRPPPLRRAGTGRCDSLSCCAQPAVRAARSGRRHALAAEQAEPRRAY